MAGAGYLPPVVAQILADASPFVSKLTEVQGLLENFAKQNTQTQLGASMTPFETDLASAKAQLLDFAKQVSDANLGVDADPFWADIAALRTELAAMNNFDINVQANTAAALAKIAALKEALNLAGIDSILGGSGGGGGTDILAPGGGGNGGDGGAVAESAVLGTLMGHSLGENMKSAFWGEVGGGLLQRLLSPLTAIVTLFSAGFGSIGQFAGFGPEHLLMTLIGLVASLTEGFMGMGVVALGAFGKMAVGGGADMLVSHEMLTNVEALVKGTETLAQVTAKVGPAAADAEDQLANAYKGMAAAFDMATGPAQVVVASIGDQFIKLADDYIPLVAKAALTNFGLISTGLQPLFSWLEGPAGMGVFENLEKLFAQQLPTAMNAFDEGVKLLLRTMDLAAQGSGGFMKWLDKMLTYLNSTAGWEKWSTIIDHLVDDFKMWAGFAKILVEDVADIFSKDADTAKSLVGWMTEMLTKLHEWITSTTGSTELKTLFTAHKAEMLALLNVLVPLGEAFVKLYLAIAPPLVEALTTVLVPLAKVLNIIVSNPFGAWAVGLLLIATRLKLLVPLLAAFGIDLTALPGLLKGAALGMTGLEAAADGEGLPIALALLANPVTWALAGVAAAGLITLALQNAVKASAKKWGDLLNTTITSGLGKGNAGDVDLPLVEQMAAQGNAAAQAFMTAYNKKLAELAAKGYKPTNNAFQNLMGEFNSTAIGKFFSWFGSNMEHGFQVLGGHIQQWAAGWGGDLQTFFTSIPGQIGGWIAGWGTPIANWFESIPAHIEGWVASWAGDLRTWFTSIPGDIGSWFGGWGSALAGWFESIPARIKGWLANWGGDLQSWFTSLPGTIRGWLSSAGTWLITQGGDIINGLLTGIKKIWDTVTTWFHDIPGEITSHIPNPLTILAGIGSDIITGLWSGMKSAWSNVTSWISGLAKTISSLKGPLDYDRALLIPHGTALMQGLAQGLTEGFEKSVRPVLASVSSALGGNTGLLPGIGTTGLSLAGAGGMGNVTISSPVTVQVAGTAAGTPQGIGSAVQQAINKNNQKLVSQIRAGAYLTAGRT